MNLNPSTTKGKKEKEGGRKGKDNSDEKLTQL
jgi:hypothetical protein